MIVHVLLYTFLCTAPALVLLPVRWLDREPCNEVRHEQGDDTEEREPAPAILPAAA